MKEIDKNGKMNPKGRARSAMLICAFSSLIFLRLGASELNEKAANQVAFAAMHATFHPLPDYPRKLSNRLLEGDALIQLNINDETGIVTDARIVKSTGERGFDQAALKTFRRWRFTPHTVKVVRIPLTFSTTNKTNDQLREARKNAIFSPTPPYPTAARFSYLQSWGVYRFIVDYETGRVTDVKIVETSGSGILDNPIVRTFRTWKFRPHTVRTVTTRFGFMFDRKGRGNAGF